MRDSKTFIEVQNEVSYKPVEEENLGPKDTFYLEVVHDGQRLAMLILILLFTLAVPIGMYFIMTHLTFVPSIQYSCSVDQNYRVLCRNVSKEECININCCYDDLRSQCFHYLPAKYNYFRENINTDTFLTLQSSSIFQTKVIPSMKISVIEIDANRFKLILHPANITYENSVVSNKTYYVRIGAKILGFDAFRRNTNQMIITSSLGPLIASHHYWEWSLHLIGEKLVGLGEIVYKENVTVTKIIYKNKYDHNTLPNFLCNYNGAVYGVRIEHDGPLEVTVLPSKLIILKSLAGNQIGVNVYMGPTVKDVVIQQKQEKLSTPLIPYWALGAHICRDGNTDINSAIQEYVDFINNPTNPQFTSDCIHDNLYTMLHEVNANHNLPTLIQELQQKSHFVMTIPPQILEKNENLYNAAMLLDILLRNNNGNYFIGSYHNYNAVFPDYNHTLIDAWFDELKKNLPSSKIDGFVLKDNWPEEDSYVFQDKVNDFPYMTKELNMSLSRTIPWNLSSNNTLLQPHLLQHNLYGKYQTIAFKNNLEYQILLTSSYDFEMSDSAIIQNVNISWTDLKKTLASVLYNSVLGNPLISIPVCGSTSHYDSEVHEDACIRWYIMAATFPLFRISSDIPRRDPSHLSTGYAKSSALNAIEKRYMLLPYYYAILSLNEPLTRPMFYNFPTDNETWNLEEQYMLGDGLLVAQPTVPAVSKLNIYLPREVNVWYEYWGGNPYVNRGWIEFNIVKNDWVMFIAEGHIIPLKNHKSSIIGKHSDEDSFSFAVALNCNSVACFSKGYLHIDTSKLTITGNENGIIIESVDGIKNDIGCNSTNNYHPRYVSSVNIYGLQDTVVKSNFSLIDLCNSVTKNLFIPYFSI